MVVHTIGQQCSLVKPVLRTAHLGQIKDCRFAVGANIRNHCFSHRNILLLPFRLPQIKVSIRSVDGFQVTVFPHIVQKFLMSTKDANYALRVVVRTIAMH